MYRNHAVAAVVPARNEAPFVGSVVDTMPAFVDRIYVVDDASEDDTRTVALDTAAESPADEPARWCPERRRLDSRVAEIDQAGRVAVLSHDEQRGAGGAVKTGYLAALDGDADLVATVDGDGQMDPRRLDRFLDPLVDGDADYAKGTRLSRREHTAGMPAFRLFGNRLLTLLCRLSSGYWSLTDPVNGYTAIRREALKAIDPASAYEGYGYGTEVLARLHAADCRIADVSHPSHYGDESSGIDYRQYTTRVSRLLLATLLWRVGRERLDGRFGADDIVEAASLRWRL
jgi:glycosyltransferase involved in cell wall biosynthesis